MDGERRTRQNITCMDIKKLNLVKEFDSISEYWSPKIAGELNGQYVKIAKFKGEFIMHHHTHEDELFYVIKGTIFIELKGKTVELNEGEMIIIPKNTPHKPFAKEEAHIMLLEPKSTLNTGNLVNERTKRNLEEI